MAKPAVPSIPPLSSISDPNVRAVLQAIVDGQRIRNGDVGDGDEKFLTVGDLGLGARSLIVGAGGAGASTVSSKITQSVANALRKISDQIMQSRAWKLLDETIVRIQGDVTGVETRLTTTSTELSALSSSTTTAIANINNNIGLVSQDLSTVSDMAGASARALTQLQTKVGDVDAAAQSALTLSTTTEGVVKGAWSVKFDVNGYIAGVALGVEKQAAAPPKSTFVVRADTFAVGSPGVQDVVPFFVTNGTTYIKKAMIPLLTADMIDTRGLTVKDSAGNIILGSGTPLSGGYSLWSNITGAGKPENNATVGATFGSNIWGQITGGNVSTYIANGAIQNAQIGYAAILNANIADGQITTAKISDATITSAKIGVAQIDTLRVAGEAVTVPLSASGYGSATTSGVYVDAGTRVCVSAYCDAGGPTTSLVVTESLTNTTIATCVLPTSSNPAGSVMGLWSAPWTGWFAFKAFTTGGSPYTTVVALVVKR